MCGIAGIFGLHLESNQAEQVCRSMLNALRHRGPDAEGFFHDDVAGLHLIHARLSIIDPTARSNQPMHRAGRLSIVFNGEIYNHKELRKELEQKGVLFNTASDTEVILALYEQDGAESFSRLRGMFAFALFDREKQCLLLARDVFGIKPLYFAENKGGVLFASEIRTLLASGLVPKKISSAGAQAFFQWGSCRQDKLPLEGVYALKPGTMATFTSGKPTQHTSFSTLPFSNNSSEISLEDFRESFLDSVQHHLVSDVPVGIFLSGGLDSSALLQAAQLVSKQRLQSFTLAFPGTSLDESALAKKQAARSGSLHTEEKMPEGLELQNLFESFISQQDLPSIDGFNTFCVSALAKRHGIKVVLSGLGGDELLGGYPSFHLIPQLLQAGAITSKIPFFQNLCAHAATHWLQGRRARLADFFSAAPTVVTAYTAVRSLFSLSETAQLMRNQNISSSPQNSTGERPKNLNKFLQQTISQLECSSYLINQLLRDADACSMTHGVEVRVPFLDHPLWKSAAQLPQELRYQSGKKVIKEILPELDADLFLHKKKGFTLPYEKWRTSDLSFYFQNAEKETQGIAQTWYQQMAWIAWNRWTKELGII